MSDYVEINGYEIRRKKNAQSASDIGFRLPKNKKTAKKEFKQTQIHSNTKNLVENIRLELNRFTGGKSLEYKQDVFKQYFDLDLKDFNQLFFRAEKYLERKLNILKEL